MVYFLTISEEQIKQNLYLTLENNLQQVEKFSYFYKIPHVRFTLNEL